LRGHLLANGVAVGEILDGSPGPGCEAGLATRPAGALGVAGIEQRLRLSRRPRSRTIGSCLADADMPPDPRSASCPRADARERRLAGHLSQGRSNLESEI
jgi:hypothetical protein